ncbi:hypothetical protein NL676_008385 [Syzygium grande]|nr:hypothetical protein NL676_008385 [Syzygium grande]
MTLPSNNHVYGCTHDCSRPLRVISISNSPPSFLPLPRRRHHVTFRLQRVGRTHRSQFKEESDNHGPEESPTGFPPATSFPPKRRNRPPMGPPPRPPPHVGVTAAERRLLSSFGRGQRGFRSRRFRAVRGKKSAAQVSFLLDWVDLPCPALFMRSRGQRARE